MRFSRKGGLAYPNQNPALYQRSFARRTGTRTAAEDRLAGLRRAIRREPASPNGHAVQQTVTPRTPDLRIAPSVRPCTYKPGGVM